MRGHLRKRSPSSWTIVLELGRDPATGKRRQQWVTARGTKRDAERRLAELIHQTDKGMQPDTGKVTVDEYLNTWLRDVVTPRREPRTTEGYGIIIKRHIAPAIGVIQLSKLQPGDVERMEASLLGSGLSANTVHHVHVVLGGALKAAMRKGLIQRNVCQLVEPPRPGRYEVDLPDMGSISRVLARADETPYGTVFRFIAHTGIRRGEAVALKWPSVDLDRGVVSMVETAQRLTGKGILLKSTKSAAGRRGIALDIPTVEMLRAHRARQAEYRLSLGVVFEDHGLVFPGPTGRPLDPSVFTRNFKKLALSEGFPELRLHDLRHAHAAGLIEAGIHPRVVQERLGHASAAFTMQVYGHVAAGLQAKAASAFADLMAEAAG